jgi:hypothetical protein
MKKFSAIALLFIFLGLFLPQSASAAILTVELL